VEAAVETGSKQAMETGMLVAKTVLPAPKKELSQSLL